MASEQQQQALFRLKQNQLGKQGNGRPLTFLEHNGLTITKNLGEGAFAKVKEAFSEPLNRKVALKIISKQRAPKDYLGKFLEREIKTTHSINHKNIIKLYDVKETRERIYLILELAENGDLLDYINHKNYNEEQKLRHHFIQLLSAMEHCHQQQIVHRDLKCENILIDENGNLKVTDFGFARQITVQDTLSTYCGSIAYACPEILQGKPYDGKAADVWSLGVILYAMLSGRLPYSENQLKELAAGRKIEQITFKCGISQDAKDLVRKLVAVNPEERISCREALQHPWFRKNADSDTKIMNIPQKSNKGETDKKNVFVSNLLVTKHTKETANGSAKGWSGKANTKLTMKSIALAVMAAGNLRRARKITPMICDLKEELLAAVVTKHLRKASINDSANKNRNETMQESLEKGNKTRTGKESTVSKTFGRRPRQNSIVQRILAHEKEIVKERKKSLFENDSQFKRKLSLVKDNHHTFPSSVQSKVQDASLSIASYTANQQGDNSLNTIISSSELSNTQGKIICERREELRRLSFAESSQIAKEASKWRHLSDQSKSKANRGIPEKYRRESIKAWQDKCALLLSK